MNKVNDQRGFIELVIEKSTKMILNKSFEEFEIDILVKEIGYSRSKVYKYFGGKKNIVALLVCDSLYNMRNFIRSKLPENLDFAGTISQMIKLRAEFIDSDMFLKKYHAERPVFSRQLKKSDLILQQEEDTILTEIITKYYNATVGATTFLGLDFNQIWTLLFTYDFRNNLRQNIQDIQKNVEEICFKKKGHANE